MPPPAIGDADSGEQLFGQQCASCHSDNGDGTFNGIPFNVNVFAGVERSGYPVTPEGVSDYIHDRMPATNPGMCVDDCADDITAFLWEYRSAP